MELATLARPYAKAVFDLAQAAGQLPQWSQRLESLAAVVQNAEVSALANHPAVSSATLVDLVVKSCGHGFGDLGENVVKLLVANHRLELAPAIAAQFETLKAEAERRIDITITAASELDEATKDRFADALKKRLGREVALQADVDTSLIGGAVIKAGDLIIDGSVRNELSRMSQALSA